MANNQQIRKQINPSFRFVVDVDDERQAAFTECTLPNIEWDVEELKEGGLNTYTHQLPSRRKATKVSLKNGIGKNELLNWYIEAISKTVKRKKLTITLLNACQEAVVVWNIEKAYPIKWSGPQLKTDGNAVAIQTLEFICGDVTVKLSKRVTMDHKESLFFNTYVQQFYFPQTKTSSHSKDEPSFEYGSH